MRSDPNRPGRCPDCRATTALSSYLPGRPPQVHHEPSCLTHLAAVQLYRNDLTWFEQHPGEGLRHRPAAPCELDDMHTALGRHVPRHERRRWEVAVIRYGTGIARTYARDGRVVAVQAIAADPAGAE